MYSFFLESSSVYNYRVIVFDLLHCIGLRFFAIVGGGLSEALSNTKGRKVDKIWRRSG